MWLHPICGTPRLPLYISNKDFENQPRWWAMCLLSSTLFTSQYPIPWYASSFHRYLSIPSRSYTAPSAKPHARGILVWPGFYQKPRRPVFYHPSTQLISRQNYGLILTILSCSQPMWTPLMICPPLFLTSPTPTLPEILEVLHASSASLASDNENLKDARKPQTIPPCLAEPEEPLASMPSSQQGGYVEVD